MTQVKPTIHIASCSFGKDSIATILAGLEHGDPIDRVVFAEVMFDNARGISGEIPEHIEWIYNTAIPKMRGMGLTIDVVRSDMDYIDYFIQRRKSGKYAGKFGGFPLGGMCKINSACKVAPIHKYLKDYRATHDVIQYIGIAADEPKRLARLDGTTKISLLQNTTSPNRWRMTCVVMPVFCRLYTPPERGVGVGFVQINGFGQWQSSVPVTRNYGMNCAHFPGFQTFVPKISSMTRHSPKLNA